MDDDRPELPRLPMLGERVERGDAAANRRRILDAARRLLTEQGADAVSMDAVAAAAGVGKGTVFRRFGDRAGLMDELVSGYMRDFQDAFISGPPPLGPGAPPAERLEAFLVALVRLQREHLPMAVAAGLPGRPGRARGAFGPLFVHIRSLVEGIDPALDADIVAAMLLGAIAPPVLAGLPDRRGDDTDAVVAAVRALLGGLGYSPS